MKPKSLRSTARSKGPLLLATHLLNLWLGHPKSLPSRAAANLIYSWSFATTRVSQLERRCVRSQTSAAELRRQRGGTCGPRILGQAGEAAQAVVWKPVSAFAALALLAKRGGLTNRPDRTEIVLTTPHRHQESLWGFRARAGKRESHLRLARPRPVRTVTQRLRVANPTRANAMRLLSRAACHDNAPVRSRRAFDARNMESPINGKTVGGQPSLCSGHRRQCRNQGANRVRAQLAAGGAVRNQVGSG